MTDDKLIETLQVLMKTFHGDGLKDTPNGGELRQKDKPWQKFGISRATWYRQGKPQSRSQFSGKYFWRQKSRAKSLDRSVRSIQRLAFARRYGIPEIETLAIHECLLPAMLEEIAKWEHEDQRRFTDRLFALAADLPKEFEPDDSWRRQFSPFAAVVLPVKKFELRRAAKSAFDATLHKMVADAKAELSR